jgi:hypothetical protein
VKYFVKKVAKCKQGIFLTSIKKKGINIYTYCQKATKANDGAGNRQMSDCFETMPN